MPRIQAPPTTSPSTRAGSIHQLRHEGCFLPSDLVLLANLQPSTLGATGLVATDTETSGLFSDDGARTSTASVAWVDETGDWAQYADRLTYAVEEIAPGYSVAICSLAWPFDQGVEPEPGETPKAEYKGQPSLDLFPNAHNLGQPEWVALVGWLGSRPGLVMHPGIFDLEKYRVGVRRWPEVGAELVEKLAWDTQNGCDLLWPLYKTALKATADRIWPERHFKDESEVVKAYLKKAKLPTGRWDLVPWDVIGTYADLDARLTKMLELRQRWEVDHGLVGAWLVTDPEANQPIQQQEACYRFLDRRLATSKALYRMERSGLPYDELGSREAAEKAAQVAAEIASTLPFAPKDAKSFFFKAGFVGKGGTPGLGLVPYAVTDQGAPSMTAEVLGRMVEDGVAHAEMYATWAKIDTARSMWYEGYADKVGPDGRLRMRFKQNGTKSTRFSASRVNLQAIPHDYRLSGYSEMEGIPSPRQLIASGVRTLCPGWRLYELDLQQAELRVAALYCRCTKMLNMMENGDDMHGETTKSLFRMQPDHPKWGQMRQVGKRGNFSLGFGAGGKTFRQMISKETGIRLGEDEAYRIVRDWNRLYPEFGSKGIKRHENVVARRIAQHGHGWVALKNGERRWFQPYEEPHKAYNQRVQGDLAQFGIDWLLQADDYLSEKGLDDTPIGGAGLLLTIHDSLNLLLPEGSRGEKWVDDIAEMGREQWKRWWPGVVGGVDVKKWG